MILNHWRGSQRSWGGDLVDVREEVKKLKKELAAFQLKEEQFKLREVSIVKKEEVLREKELYDLIFKKHSIYEQSAGIDWFSWKKELYNGHPETVFNDLNKLIIKLHGKRDLEDLATVLKKFADFCHTKYLGCWRDKKEDSWKYSYETEVGNMVKKYIKFLEKKD